MLWSQIKLTQYDFSDLQITSEFDNRRALLLITGGSSTHKTLLGDFQMFLELFTYRMMCRHWNCLILNLKQKSSVSIRCVQVPTRLSPRTIRCLADVILPQWPYKIPYRRRRILSSTLYINFTLHSDVDDLWPNHNGDDDADDAMMMMVVVVVGIHCTTCRRLISTNQYVTLVCFEKINF